MRLPAGTHAPPRPGASVTGSADRAVSPHPAQVRYFGRGLSLVRADDFVAPGFQQHEVIPAADDVGQVQHGEAAGVAVQRFFGRAQPGGLHALAHILQRRLLLDEFGIQHGVIAGGFRVREMQFGDGLDIALGPGVGAHPHRVEVGLQPVQRLREASGVGELGLLEVLQRFAGIAGVQHDDRIGDLELVLLHQLVEFLVHVETARQAGLLEARLVQGLGGENRPLALDIAVAGQVLGFERLPAGVEIGRQYLLQGRAIRIFLQADQRRQHGQSSEEADFELGMRRLQVFLRLREDAFDLLRTPFHFFRQWRIAAEHPQHMVALADLPQTGPGTLAHQQHGLGVRGRRFLLLRQRGGQWQKQAQRGQQAFEHKVRSESDKP
ncbi:conserved hypothetical protein [Ricinus communis]|uniref:Uncharacterized protein n=1 Tax=Ricinus communis TaxID=3988 RepID=B9TK75_RICCO|nr:conserved hypothetical protein [Ricinus communis]